LPLRMRHAAYPRWPRDRPTNADIVQDRNRPEAMKKPGGEQVRTSLPRARQKGKARKSAPFRYSCRQSRFVDKKKTRPHCRRRLSAEAEQQRGLAMSLPPPGALYLLRHRPLPDNRTLRSRRTPEELSLCGDGGPREQRAPAVR